MLTPLPQNLLLLQACFSERADEFARAWEQTADIEAYDADAHALLPLLKESSEKRGLKLHDQERIAGVYRYWWTYNSVNLKALVSALDALRDQSVDTLVIGDAALALGVYGRPALRPIVRIEVLIPPTSQPTAAYALITAGWKAQAWVKPRRALLTDTLDFEGPQGQKITLRWHAVDRCCWSGVDDRLWAQARSVQWSDRDIHIPSLADLVALANARPAKVWATVTPALWWADTLAAAQCGNVDWSHVLDTAKHYERSEPTLAVLAELHSLFPEIVPATAKPVSRLPKAALAWRLEKRAVLADQPVAGWRAHFIRWWRIARRTPLYSQPMQAVRYIVRWYDLPISRNLFRNAKRRLKGAI